MFAPKIAKAQTKAAESPTRKLAPQPSTLVARPFGNGAVEQARMLQGTIGNQATLRYLTQRLSNLSAKGSAERHEQEAAPENMTARETPRGASWDFSKIPLFPPDPTSRSQASYPLPGIIQPKLVVGKVNDPLEHQADRVADQVMRMPNPELSIAPEMPKLSRKCATCQEEEAKMLQPKLEAPAKASASDAPAIVHDALRSPGQPLDASARAFFEPRFRADFSRVRIHANDRSAASGDAVNALAYTVGSHIVFGTGRYSPTTESGQRLLAHELAHVVQQTGSQRFDQKLMRQTPAQQPAQPGPGQQPTATMLRPCNPAIQYPAFTSAVASAAKLTNDAVNGLRSALLKWGREPRSTEELATSNALAKGFNIAFDKTIWVSVLGMDQAEVTAQDARDKAAVSAILANFQQIQSDVGNYSSPPPCPPGMNAGATCVGCVDGRHASCRASEGDVMAWVPHPFLGHPSSPMMLCPAFFTLTSLEQASIVVHELAHLQNFAASDKSGGTRYYGCPIEPIEPNAPGLNDPREFLKIADAYRCFVTTQASTASAFANLGVGAPAAPSTQTPSAGPATPSP